MLAAVLIANSKGSYVVRPLIDTDKEKVTQIIETFLLHKSRTKESKGILETEIGDYFYQELEDTVIGVLGEASDTAIFKGIKVLELGINLLSQNFSLSNYGPEMGEIVTVIDEIFTSEGVIDRNIEDISKIVRFQSNDEVLHQMIEKNREKEMEKAIKAKKKVPPVLAELSKEIEEIKILKEGLRQDRPAPKPKALPPLTYTFSSHPSLNEAKVSLLTLQKLSSTYNTTNEATRSEGSGELIMKISDEFFSGVKIDLLSKPPSSRSHPTIDKKLFSQNKIIPKMEIPINRELTLLKWVMDTPELPIEVSFWQNEVSEERYKFFIEVTALKPIKAIEARIPIRRVSDIEITNGTIQGDYLTTRKENLPQDESFSVEFTGLCDDTASLFPATITYLTETLDSLSPVKIASIYTNDSEEVPDQECALVLATEGLCTLLAE
ncbi:hypothetical protein NEDG_01732 [Nematocida displodere]|uniref:Coatomer subunit delta n=1 Tax=Nematocida displodere TaxID=1805483 RepID=A0A177EGM8_9MICR|nr:hypothetical protein NEDG_01732 [Nematocida displodere]